MISDPPIFGPAAEDLEGPVLLLTKEERYLLATVVRRARDRGWRSGHRLGWVHQDRGLAVGVDPGVLTLWRRDPAGRWPTHPVSSRITTLDEAVHVLIDLVPLPNCYCHHSRRVLADLVRAYDLAADALERDAKPAAAGNELLAAGVWREAAQWARRSAEPAVLA